MYISTKTKIGLNSGHSAKEALIINGLIACITEDGKTELPGGFPGVNCGDEITFVVWEYFTEVTLEMNNYTCENIEDVIEYVNYLREKLTKEREETKVEGEDVVVDDEYTEPTY